VQITIRHKYIWPATALILGCVLFVISAFADIQPLPIRKPLGEKVSSYNHFAALSALSSSQIQLIEQAKPTSIRDGINTIPQEVNIDRFSERQRIALPLKKPLPIRGSQRLGLHDARLYNRIFELQKDGNWDAADKEIAKLSDMRLMGHVLHQRFMHPTKYRAKYNELESWMSVYHDHPNAARVFKLAMSRKPHASRSPHKATYQTGVIGRLDLDAGKAADKYVSKKRRSRNQKIRMRDLRRLIRRDLAGTAPTRAYKRMQTAEFKNLFDAVEYDQIRANVALSYLFVNKLEKSLTLSQASADRSGVDAPVAGWVAGLANWRRGNYERSAYYFEQVGRSDRATAWTVSAGAYWAARAHLRNQAPKKASYWLKQAAQHPYSFYGLIANRALGVRHIKFDWKMPTVTDKEFAKITSYPAGQRAIALLDAGQFHLAENELRQINVRSHPEMKEIMLSLANDVSLPGLAMRLGGAVKQENGRLYDAALYPMSPWQPKQGFEVDRALVYAFIRQESRFNPTVSSRTGASGLMQLMPTTASYIAGKNKRHFAGKEGRLKLYDPALNMELGQKYLVNLLNNGNVKQNLFKLTIAYNAGPGRMRRWEKEMEQADDPLLFIESIPAAETRAFVERVMTNYWIYRMRMQQNTPSLAAVASGKWPLYKTQDSSKTFTAALSTTHRWQ